MRIIRVLAPAAIAAVFVIPHVAAFAASAEKGKAAYVKNGCWQCHGFVGQGGLAGPKIAPDPMRHLMTAVLPKRMVDRIIAKRLGLMPPA